MIFNKLSVNDIFIMKTWENCGSDKKLLDKKAKKIKSHFALLLEDATIHQINPFENVELLENDTFNDTKIVLKDDVIDKNNMSIQKIANMMEKNK